MSLDSAAKAWEEINATFESTLAVYLGACQALESSASAHSASLNRLNIISSLGSRLDTFQTQLTQQLVDARLCLARAQNKLSRTVYCLPDEILAEIFYLAISNTNSSYHPFFDYEIRAQYIRLNQLLGVCTVWRRVGISYSTLWTLIPLVKNRPRDAIILTLERSQGSRLRLAGMVDSITPLIWNNSGLAQNGPRFSSVNLYPKADQPDPESIRDAISAILKSSQPGLLTDLSLYSWEYSTSPPQATGYLFPQYSPLDALFGRFADSLDSLRIHGFNIYWGGVTLTRLVELRLQGVVLGNTDLLNFLIAAASAPSLRSLHIISITTCDAQTNTSQLDQSVPSLPVLLPALQLLYLEELYQNTLELVLRSIRPGSYRVVLQYGSTRCSCINTPAGEVYLGIEALRLQDLKIDLLMLREECMDEEELRLLLQAMPTLKELYINDWDLTLEGLKAMTRFPEDTTDDGIFNFPKLHTLYLLSCDIEDIENTEEFKNLVASHEIQDLRLSVAFKVPLAPGEERSDTSSEMSLDFPSALVGSEYPGASQGPDDSQDSSDSNDSDDSIHNRYSRTGCALTDPRASSLKNWLDMTVPKVNYATYAEELPEPNFVTRDWRMW